MLKFYISIHTFEISSIVIMKQKKNTSKKKTKKELKQVINVSKVNRFLNCTNSVQLLWHLLQSVPSEFPNWLSLDYLYLWLDNNPFDSSFEHEKFSMSSRQTNKLCLPQFCLWLTVQSLQSSLHLGHQITWKTEEVSMFGKSCAVSLLIWLLVVPFFNQIDGNNTVSPSKVRLLLYFIAGLFYFRPVRVVYWSIIKSGYYKSSQYFFVSRILRLIR